MTLKAETDAVAGVLRAKGAQLGSSTRGLRASRSDSAGVPAPIPTK
jgi:hypothetical protein